MRPVLLLALLPACGAPVVHTIAEAKRLEPEKAVPKDSKDSKPARPSSSFPETTPPPSPAARTGPFRRPGAAAGQTDDFTFWGWSDDNQRYAFEVHDHGPGATLCEGSYTLFVVDAARDAFVAGTPLKVEHRTKGDEAPCDPPDLAAEMLRQVPPVLVANGINAGNQRPPIEPTRIATTTGLEKHPAWQIELAPDVRLRAEIEVRHGGREQAGEPGGAYRLTLQRDGAEPLVVEKGERRRPFVWNYSLDGGLAFLAPDGRRVAIFVATTQLSYEGDRHSWISNGVTLPPTWIPGAIP